MYYLVLPGFELKWSHTECIFVICYFCSPQFLRFFCLSIYVTGIYSCSLLYGNPRHDDTQFLKNHFNVNENLAHLQFGPVMNSVAMNSSLQK